MLHNLQILNYIGVNIIFTLYFLKIKSYEKVKCNILSKAHNQRKLVYILSPHCHYFVANFL